MRLRDLRYPAVVSMFLGFSCFLHLSEVGKVLPELQTWFIVAKFFFGLLNLFLAYRFQKYGIEPKFEPVILLSFVGYALTFMWFAPLYEVAYLQCALGAAFFKLRRPWLFHIVFGLGLIGIIVTYKIQDSIGWVLPQVERSDWIWTMLSFFLLAWFIQNFAIGVSRDERQRVLRFGMIGRETTRLIHDLKGLLSSPLALAEQMQTSTQKNSEVDREAQIQDLATEMGHVRGVLHSIQRLVQVETNLSKVNIREVLLETFHLLSRRLEGTKIRLCNSREVTCDYQRVQSVFFNLILNSLEAHRKLERKEQLVLTWSWDGNALVMTDNAGGILTTRKSGTGLGLELAAEDMIKMGGRLDIKSNPPLTTARLRFKS